MTSTDTLYNIWRTAEFFYNDLDQKRAQVDAYHSIEWYVTTGRSTVAFDRSLAKANPAKLLKAILKGGDSVDEQIASTKAYLTRYCGL